MKGHQQLPISLACQYAATTSPKLCMSSLVVPLRDHCTTFAPKFLNMLIPNVLSFVLPTLGNDIYSRIVLLWTNLDKQKPWQFHRKNRKELKTIYTSKIQLQLILVQRSLLKCTAIKSKSWDRKKTWAPHLHSKWNGPGKPNNVLTFLLRMSLTLLRNWPTRC